MDDLIDLWTEIVQDSDATGIGGFGGISSEEEYLFDECLENSKNLRIWDGAKDETLKKILSMINRMLNEPRTISKGLSLLNNFVLNIQPSRFVIIQEPLLSALHLTMKHIESEMTQQFLTDFLPKCLKYPDINQVVTTTIVSKILSYLCEELRTSALPSISGVNLLKVCLQKYHGPCGNFRSNLEKAILPVIDRDSKAASTTMLLQILPLLSTAGGGGTKGEKHSQDWSHMVGEILGSMHVCINSLYEDACSILQDPSHNPTQNEEPLLKLPAINEENVFKRTSLWKRRLVNFSTALGCYLREEFPVPKLVPVKGVLEVITKMLLINPVDILKHSGGSARREFVFLATILPTVHETAFSLLQSLISCVGHSILTEAVRIEQLFSQEFKWMLERRDSLEILKIKVYEVMLCWLTQTANSVTTVKTVSGWIDYLRKDISIQRETVELNPAAKSRKKAHQKVSSANSISNSTAVGSIVDKSSQLCQLSLNLLAVLLPSASPISHKTVHFEVARTVAEFTQVPKHPSPYDEPICRISAFKCLHSMAMNPHESSPISVSLIIGLIRQGQNDPVQVVSTSCTEILAALERLVHPICPAMYFPNTFSSHNDPEEEVNENTSRTENQEPDTESRTAESFCQTDNEINFSEEIPLNSSRASDIGLENIKDTIAQTIQESLDKLLLHRPTIFRETYSMNGYSNTEETVSPTKERRIEKSIPPLFPSLDSPKGNQNLASKRKAEVESPSTPKETQSTLPKKTRTSHSDDTYTEWLKDFVNAGPD